MNNNNLQAYSANVHRGIAAAFVGEKLGAHAYAAIQAPHTLTYPFVLSQPTVANVNRALKMNRAIEATTSISPVRITTERGAILIEVPSPTPVVIQGKTLRGEGLSVPIGMSSRREIVGVDFDADSHLLIVGATNKGKTVCARNVVYQLLRQHAPDELQLIVSCFKAKNWAAFAPFSKIITDMDQTVAMLEWARSLMYERATTGIESPRIFIVLDDCLNLFAKPGVNEIMSELLPLARGCGINFILISQRLAGMDRKVTGNCSARIVFNVTDTADSGIVGGRADLGAESLGRYPGDCLLIANEGVQRVASAYVQNDEIEKFAVRKNWNCAPLETMFAHPLRTPDYGSNGDYLSFAQGVLEMAENGDFGHTRASAQSAQTLTGKPKTEEERNMVREVFERCNGSFRATTKAIWDATGGNYNQYVRECIEDTN